jgi:hypothetical protein
MRELYQRYCDVKERLDETDPSSQAPDGEAEETEDQKTCEIAVDAYCC